MGLSFRLTHTVYDGTLANAYSNLFMCPTQSLFDHRTYYFYTKKNGDFSHICYDEKTSQVMEYFNTLIGVIHSCYCLFNIVGFLMHTFTYLKQQSEAYFLAEAAITESFVKQNQQWPMINMAALERSPPNVEPTKEELEAIQSIKTTELIDIWKKVAEHSEKAKITQDLFDWLTKIVPCPEKYTHIAKDVAPEASAALERNIKLIIHQMRTQPELSNTQKERHIIAIIDKAFFSETEFRAHPNHSDDPLQNRVACSPTWIEITQQVYKELKGGGNAETRLLLYLQQIKEDIIHELSEEIQRQGSFVNIEWHGLNIGRTLIGKEIGLDRSNLKYDSTFHLSAVTQVLLKYPVLYRFFQRCPPEELKTRLIKKISIEHLGNRTNGLDPELMIFLKPFAEEYSKQNGIDYEDDSLPLLEWGFENFVRKYFFEYDPMERKYHFNTLGAKGLLTLMGIPV